MADFDGDPFDGRGDDAERREEHGVAVARNDLGRDRLGLQAHFRRDMFFDARIDIGESADRAGNGAGGDFFAGGDEAGAAAGEFGISLGHFEAEGHRLGVNAVRAPDDGREFVLEGALFDCGEQGVHVGDQNIGGAGHLHGQAGVEHVGGGHALMDEARIRPDEFGEMGQKGDDVMLGHALDLVDAVDVEGDVSGLVPDVFRALLGDHADFGEGVAGVGLDLEPDLNRVCGSQMATISGRE